MAALAADRGRGRLGGRSTVMTTEKIDVVQRMLDDGQEKAVIARTCAGRAQQVMACCTCSAGGVGL